MDESGSGQDTSGYQGSGSPVYGGSEYFTGLPHTPETGSVTENWSETWTSTTDLHYSLAADGQWYGAGGSTQETGNGGGQTVYIDGGTQGGSYWSLQETDDAGFTAALTNTLAAGVVYGGPGAFITTGTSSITADGHGDGSGGSSSVSNGTNSCSASSDSGTMAWDYHFTDTSVLTPDGSVTRDRTFQLTAGGGGSGQSSGGTSDSSSSPNATWSTSSQFAGSGGGSVGEYAQWTAHGPHGHDGR